MENEKGSNISRQILCMKLRYWLYLILFFQYTLIVFLFGCVGTRRWVRKGVDSTEWEGGLLTITSSNSYWKSMTYKDAKSEICDMNLTDSDLCTIFGHLYSAGAAYLFFELLALIFLFVWIFQVILALLEKPLRKPWIVYIWPSSSFICHIIAIAIWAGITKANFEDDCLNLNSSKICSTNGPALAILTAFLYLFFGAIYVFVHLFRDGIVKSKPEEGNQDLERV